MRRVLVCTGFLAACAGNTQSAQRKVDAQQRASEAAASAQAAPASSAVIQAADAGGAPSAGPALPIGGDWATGRGRPEPAESVLRIERGCFSSPGHWHLQVTGAHVVGSLVPGSQVGGALRNVEPASSENVRGTIDGDRVDLDGDEGLGYVVKGSPSPAEIERMRQRTPPAKPVHYALHYDARTTHLTGTRNGEPFWAVRFTLSAHQGPCGSPPP